MSAGTPEPVSVGLVARLAVGRVRAGPSGSRAAGRAIVTRTPASRRGGGAGRPAGGSAGNVPPAAACSAPGATLSGRMAKLYFHYSTMNAGKSTALLQASHNYRERGMATLLLTARLDDRAGRGRIASRIGIGAEAETYDAATDLFAVIATRLTAGPVACVFLDEAQFLTRDQVWQLARAVDDLGVPVMCYGLRVDFRGELFPGSAVLLALADEMREVRTICHCGKKATMVVRRGSDGKALRDGAQVQIGGNETYVSLCRRHWREAIGDRSPDAGPR